MSNAGWAPKPRRDLNLGGLFSHAEGEVRIEKANRWQEQSMRDGTPPTRRSASALMPPSAGEPLYLEGVSKATAADSAPFANRQKEEDSSCDPDDVVKAYFSVVNCLQKGDVKGAIAAAQSVDKQKVQGASEDE